MVNEKRLIDAKIAQHIADVELTPDEAGVVQWVLSHTPTVDAVPVDEIRVDITSLSLENQEAILNVSICGNPNEVKLPFSKEVAEVVHGRWCEKCVAGFNKVFSTIFVCSECEKSYRVPNMNYCPNCGAKMDGGTL